MKQQRTVVFHKKMGVFNLLERIWNLKKAHAPQCQMKALGLQRKIQKKLRNECPFSAQGNYMLRGQKHK